MAAADMMAASATADHLAAIAVLTADQMALAETEAAGIETDRFAHATALQR